MLKDSFLHVIETTFEIESAVHVGVINGVFGLKASRVSTLLLCISLHNVAYLCITLVFGRSENIVLFHSKSK